MAESDKRILVVEDDPEMSSLLCALLRTAGYAASAVGDGAAAIASVAEDPPDAIVLDVMLPDMSGFDICQRLKLQRETNLISILMLTALGDTSSRHAGVRVGANCYLTKPFDPDELLNEVASAIGHRQAMEQHQTHTSIDLQMDSDLRSRQQLNDLLSELFVLTPLSAEEIGRIRYAALEMIANAAEWGNRKSSERMVKIRYEVTDALVRFVISDEGVGFDPAAIPHAADSEDPTRHMELREKLGLREGGFGILISKGMVDEFNYNEAGNTVTLVKYFKQRC